MARRTRDGWTPDEQAIRRLTDAYTAGVSPSLLANRYGVSRQWVLAHVRTSTAVVSMAANSTTRSAA